MVPVMVVTNLLGRRVTDVKYKITGPIVAVYHDGHRLMFAVEQNNMVHTLIANEVIMEIKFPPADTGPG